jgi:hypothetical protein
MQLGAFLAGCLVGAVAGVVAIGPLLRAAWASLEYRRASREAELSDELLRRLTEDSPGPAARLDPR